jgi:hypothetical protein
LKTFKGNTITSGTTFRGEIKDFGDGPVAVNEEWYIGLGGYFGGGIDDIYVEDGSWTRLRELSLSYNLNNEFTKSIGIQNALITATGRNLLLWTEFEGTDPDTNVSGVSSSRGIDYFNNPGTKSYVFSLTLTF